MNLSLFNDQFDKFACLTNDNINFFCLCCDAGEGRSLLSLIVMAGFRLG